MDIQAIHNSPIFGVYIETGASVPIANALLNEAGASKTVYLTESPYNQEYVVAKYGLDPNTRSVSTDFVLKVLDYYQPLLDSKRINTIYVSTFQVSNKDASMVTHGWIGLQYYDTIVLYHISVRKWQTRQQHIADIAHIGLKLLFSTNVPLRGISNLCVDIILSVTKDVDVNGYVNYTLHNIYDDSSNHDLHNTYDDSSNYNLHDTYNIYNYMGVNDIICWTPNFEMVRAEDMFRGRSGIKIYDTYATPSDGSIARGNAVLGVLPEDRSYIIYLQFQPNIVDYRKIIEVDIRNVCSLGYYCISGMLPVNHLYLYSNSQFPDLTVTYDT